MEMETGATFNGLKVTDCYVMEHMLPLIRNQLQEGNTFKIEYSSYDFENTNGIRIYISGKIISSYVDYKFCYFWVTNDMRRLMIKCIDTKETRTDWNLIHSLCQSKRAIT